MAYSDYDAFAWIYNRYWGSAFTAQVLPIIENLILSHLPENANLLDVCCGTGNLANLLTRKGYTVTGIDGSTELL